MSFKHARKVRIMPLLALPILLLPLQLSAQEEGGAEVEGGMAVVGGGEASGGGGEEAISGPLDLDYTDEEDEIFDVDAYEAAESQLQIGKIGKPQGIGLIHEAAKAKSSIVLGVEGGPIAPIVPEYYVIQKGDTLFYLSEYFFGDPELWPGVWSLNPDITNPNWIYPGQELLLAPGKGPGEEGEGPSPGIPTFLGYTPWKEGTEYLRPYGFIDKDIEEETGEIIGAFQETMYLDKYHKVYIKYKEGKAPAVGSKATIYEVVSDVKDNEKRNIKYGKLVRILGAVKITKVDKDHKIATGVIDECIRPIERGDFIGPIKWKFKTTEPVKASLDLEGKIIAPLEDVEHSGQFDVIFINLGKKDGLVVGNIVKIVRKRDPYEESKGKKDKSQHFPWEVVGKAMVIESLKKTATCIVLESSLDIKLGDKVWLKRGE
jgi:hypothetical protein